MVHYARVILLVFLAVMPAAAPPATRAAETTLPARIDDREFWRMIEDFSEPNGYFRSDNLLSNELSYPAVIPELVQKAGPGGAYLGVGPEQNFNYIVALKPKIVIISDIRRGNLHLHLMYKALFELSSDRADFVGRLFTKTRPEGLDRHSSARRIFDAYADAPTGDEAAYKANLQAIDDLLVKKHGLALSSEDLAGIDYVYSNFYKFGPGIHYGSSGRSFGRGSLVTYADLMVEADGSGVVRSYLATEESFEFLKGLETRNLVVPIVGDFGGPKAIRAAGKYLKEHGATVTAFYLSNVEQYLGALWNNFCASVASLPLDERSTFIRSSRGGGGPGPGLTVSLGSMKTETNGCSESH
jgi:hypothetical protein